MALTADERAIVSAVVRAEEMGDDPHTAALDAVPSLEANRDRFHLTLRRLADAGYLDVALNHGDGRLLAAHVRRSLPKGVDLARTHSEAEVLTVVELRLVERVLHDLHALVESEQVTLSAEDRADLEAQVATVDAQIRSPRPRRRIILESLRSARNILEGAAGSGLAAGVIHLISKLS